MSTSTRTTTRTTDRDDSQQTELFVGDWMIGNSMPGAPIMQVNLMFDAPSSKVSGYGRVSQAISPPLDVRTRLDGDYTYMTVMPDNTHILVTLIGHPILTWPAGGIGPLIPPNTQVRMVLDADWQSGTATFGYATSEGEWHQIESVPVTRTPHLPEAGK